MKEEGQGKEGSEKERRKEEKPEIFSTSTPSLLLLLLLLLTALSFHKSTPIDFELAFSLEDLFNFFFFLKRI